ncbi:3-hydroxyacyl-CoA dehydrogenase [Furfurilactobacillus milii]|uniref:3-hydroxyacyl-CoA dehydrogenase n=1 Tax=Furfurilactobacillus milii TaxID=2888272 RepID=A0A6N9I4K1_9LACO|nr:3-hydroxyacyl-CoA dehydrogenase [Furfurilactobacillus milii]MYV17890.1 3-hydroxyacyl-CoA dehydrogenase [Furfurilactobacillus milii]
MSIKHVTVAGSGVLGSQIAFQVAFKGFDVTIYDINDDVIDKAKTRIGGLAEIYASQIASSQSQFSNLVKGTNYNANLLPGLPDAIIGRIQDAEKVARETPARISYATDLKTAVQDSDLVIEAIPELLDLKTKFYQQLSQVAPSKTIFATNSSTLIPSQFAEATGRPKQFLALHFANEIWKNNTAEIMGHAGTDANIYQTIVQFAKDIGMIAIEVKKEQPGYILNSILVPFLHAAQLLYLKGVGDPQTIDRTWMIATGSPMGPFAILDMVGIQTVYNIIQNYVATTGDPDFKQLATMMKTEYLDKGKLGVSSGEGFYHYPNPAFEDENFLKG